MKKTLLFIAMTVSVAALSQTSYTLSTYTEDYTELTNPTIMTEYDVDDDTWDDPVFIVPFGFDFEIGGETFNSSIQLGGGSLMGFGDFLNPEETSIHVFGLTEDLVDGDYVEGLPSSEISYTTTGTVGDRIAKLQYQNAAFYDEAEGPEPAAENRINFQLWFYENGGIMEIHFGESTIPNPELAFYGNPGPSAIVAINIDFDFENIDYGGAIIGDPLNPTLFEFTTVPDEEEQTGLDGIPLSGRVYRLAPSNPLGIFETKTPEFNIYPTVADHNLWVKGDVGYNSNYRILDITGKVVMTGKLQNQNPINVSKLNAGVYLFSIEGMNNAAEFIKK